MHLHGLLLELDALRRALEAQQIGRHGKTQRMLHKTVMTTSDDDELEMTNISSMHCMGPFNPSTERVMACSHHKHCQHRKHRFLAYHVCMHMLVPSAPILETSTGEGSHLKEDVIVWCDGKVMRVEEAVLHCETCACQLLPLAAILHHVNRHVRISKGLQHTAHAHIYL